MAIGIFSSIDPNLIIYGLLFVVFFVFIQLVLSRSLKDKSSASIIALCVSLLAVYGIYKAGFDLSSFTSGLGINDNVIYDILPFIIIAGIIFILWKVKLRFLLTIAGIGLLIGSFFVYEQTVVRIIGGVLLVIGLFLMWKESRRSVNRRIYVK